MTKATSDYLGKAWVVRSDEKRHIEGIIYPPFQLDTYNTMMFPADIAKMCHDFTVRRMEKQVDHEHDQQLSGCTILRHWIALDGDPDGYPAGAWVGLCYVERDDLWDKVKRGEINGYSIHANAAEIPMKGLVQRVVSATGTTELSTDCQLVPPHTHDVVINFRADGTVIPTETSEVHGHTHMVAYAAATQRELEHSHALIITTG